MPIGKLLSLGVKAMAKKVKGGEVVSKVLKRNATSVAKARRDLEKAKRRVSILRSADKPDKQKIILAEDKVKTLQKLADTGGKPKPKFKSYLTTDPIQRKKFEITSKVVSALKKKRK